MTSIEKYEAAPGSYNLSQDLTTKSQVYFNSPRPLIPKGKRQPSIYFSFAHSKDLMGLDSPPVSKYSPNASIIYKSCSVSKFGNETRKDHFLQASGRSPGPIYMYSVKDLRTCSFGKGEKVTFKTSDEPGPCTYQPKMVDAHLPVKIKGYASDRMYLKNMESTYKGKQGPGPGKYSVTENLNKGIKWSRSTRLKSSNTYSAHNNNPGPGSYSSLPQILNKKSHGFGGSKKSLDIRACTLYIDSNSIELFR